MTKNKELAKNNTLDKKSILFCFSVKNKTGRLKSKILPNKMKKDEIENRHRQQ